MTFRKAILKTNHYLDSATLMALAQKAKGLDGVSEAVAVMATPANKELLANVGLLDGVADASSARDLILAVEASSREALNSALEALEKGLKGEKRPAGPGRERLPRTIHEALDLHPNLNLALISVPGQYATREARKALESGMHVMLFSDNVSLEHEIELKQLAARKGLLMMGPDCGTAFISGAPLAFANVVRQGSIGVVAAAGTGLQEIACLVDRWYGGISQGLGTGGRDLKEAVGGLQFIQSFRALLEDEGTRVIILTGKPPAPSVEKKILSMVAGAEKPVIVNLLGGNREAVRLAGGIFAGSLEEAARLAVERVGVAAGLTGFSQDLVDEAVQGVLPGQKWLRGLYTGGTLCYEALLALDGHLGDVYSNTPIRKELALRDSRLSFGHTVLDLGDDEFTRGRPHPMIEPSIRGERVLVEATDPEVAVLLLDFVLGYGAHRQPVEAISVQLNKAMALAADRGGKLVIVASVTGTAADPQGLDDQVERLRKLGVYVLPSNYQAVAFAKAIIQQLGRAEG